MSARHRVAGNELQQVEPLLPLCQIIMPIWIDSFGPRLNYPFSRGTWEWGFRSRLQYFLPSQLIHPLKYHSFTLFNEPIYPLYRQHHFLVFCRTSTYYCLYGSLWVHQKYNLHRRDSSWNLFCRQRNRLYVAVKICGIGTHCGGELIVSAVHTSAPASLLGDCAELSVYKWIQSFAGRLKVKANRSCRARHLIATSRFSNLSLPSLWRVSFWMDLSSSTFFPAAPRDIRPRQFLVMKRYWIW